MIEVERLTKHYGPVTAIRDVSFSVAPGQIVGFLGPNGAGKSTTMRILSCFMPASSGSARVAGYDVFRESLEVRRRIGYLPENVPLYSEMRVGPYLEFVAEVKGVSRSDRRRRVADVMDRCRVADVQNRLIGTLSKGYRQRVGLAQAIVSDPEVLILDEPTIGLDPRQITEIRSLIKSLAGQHTVILSSHILSEVAATCERVLIINQGRIVADDTPQRLTEGFGRDRGLEIEMLVRGEADLVDIEAKLRAVAGVDGVVVTSEGEQLWRAVVSGRGAGLREELTRAAVEAGLGVREVHARKLTLEDVFLSLTTDDET